MLYSCKNDSTMELDDSRYNGFDTLMLNDVS